MPTLNELQKLFFNAMLFCDEKSLKKYILPNRLTPESSLKIYRNNIFNTLIKSLQAIFPRLQQLTGENFFKQAASAYVIAFPSNYKILQKLEKDSPSF